MESAAFEIRAQGSFGVVYAPTTSGGLRKVAGVRIGDRTVTLTKRATVAVVRHTIGRTYITETRQITLPLSSIDSIRVACEWFAS
jgi:hypothetical protein